jgi:AraC-like DNA-binding protein
MSSPDQLQAFTKSLVDPGSVAALFDHVPDSVFFVKDRQCRLMMGNGGLLRLLRQPHMDRVIGKTGYDFFPKGIADGFERDDQAVMADGGKPQLDEVELIIDEQGTLCWFCTTKLPLYGHDGEVVGLMGLTRNLRQADPRLSPFAKMLPVIEHLRTAFATSIDMAAMAKLAGLSPSQFRRSFKTLFREAPLQFVLGLRVQHAANLLATTNLNMGEIADRCGFADQSYFARQFRTRIGLTPRAYRKTVS